MGGILFKLIENQFPSTYKIFEPEMPKYMPLKLLMLGYDFSGKKTMCELLKSKYDIEVIQTEELIRELVEMVYMKS